MPIHSTIIAHIRFINIHHHQFTIRFHLHHINQVKWNNTTIYDKHHSHPSAIIQIQSFSHMWPFTKDSQDFSPSRFISTKFVSKSHLLKIIEFMNQNQLYKLNCLCHVFSQVTYRCSRGYISISSAKNNEFKKNPKFVSLFTFSQNFPFSKQNKLNPSHHSLNTTKHLNWTHKT